MNYRSLPDAPESVKYHGGYDPSDPPQEDDGMIECSCGHRGFEEETLEVEGLVLCVNCGSDFTTFGTRNPDATGKD